MKDGEALGGPPPAGHGGAGDYILENDEIALVVGGQASQQAGTIVDAADARVRVGELGQMKPYFGDDEYEAIFGEVSSGTEPSGSAWIEARGHVSSTPLEVVRRYTLAAPDRAVLVTTTLSLPSSAGAGNGDAGTGVPMNLSLGDAVDWGAAQAFAPDRGLAFEGPSSGAYIAGIGEVVSYGLTSTSGEIDAETKDNSSKSIDRPIERIDPGASVSYERVLMVGVRGDVASVVAELTHATGGALGELEVALVDANDHAIAFPSGGKIVLSTPRGGNVLSLRAREDGASLVGEVPPGSYLTAYVPDGRYAAMGEKQPVDVKANERSKATLVVRAVRRR
jgi:hypothetical protein